MFTASSFHVVEHMLTFSMGPSHALQQALEQRWPGYTHFGNNGVLAVLKRSAGCGMNLSSSSSSTNVVPSEFQDPSEGVAVFN